MRENNSATNIILIGMPGAGKSTLGVVLAKNTSRNFVDTDLLIQGAHTKSLQQIVEAQGYQKLREIEQEILLSLDIENTVIATGGSAVYSEAAMNHLARKGHIVFLDVDREVLEQRIGDYSERGIAKSEEQSFADLFEERQPLYRKYADSSIKCSALTQDQACNRIIEQLAI